MAVSLYLVALLTSCLTLLPTTFTLTTSGVLFSDTGRSDVIFNGDVLFDETDVSVISCVRRGVRGASLAFTFTKQGSNPGHCRGYADSFTATSTDVTAQAGARTYMREAAVAAVADPCDGNYTILDDMRRLPGSLVGDVTGYPIDASDNSRPPGWYRFQLDGTNAYMLDTPPTAKDMCTSPFAIWFSLEGQSYQGPSQEVTGRACVADLHADPTQDCRSNEHMQCTVRDCGNFLIYNMHQMPTSSMANICVDYSYLYY